MLIGDISAAAPTLLDTGVVVSPLIGSAATTHAVPHAKLVRQPANYVTQAHFHEVDQYQVVVEGDGRFGAERVRCGTFHYTDRATPYGPIVSDPDRVLSYLTLRPRAAAGVDVGAQYMPGARANRSRLPGRNLLGAAPEHGAWTTLTEQQDGVCSRGVTTGARQAVEAPADRCGPAYLTVLGGELVVSGRGLAAPSVIWLEADDPWPGFAAGDDGVRLLWTRFSESHGGRP
jgi:hypothetical protein